jgi:predicted metalloprotease with PDZ domain
VLSGSGALRNPSQRVGLLGTVAHEFFHAWNMERIRAGDLEPFDFEDADVSAELWFGEGVTSYYDDLIMRRTGLAPFEQTLGSFANIINAVTVSPARQFRSAEDMSRLAPFVDAAVSVDPTAWDNTFISYYTFGAALGLGLDLMLRDRSDGRDDLDTFMQALWARHGRPGQKEPGIVATPYTTNDLQNALAEISGDAQFAKSFFARFVQGNEAIDYAPLLLRAGLVLRAIKPDIPALVGSRLEFGGSAGIRVEAPVTFDSPLYKAGVERDDLIVSVDGFKMTSEKALRGVLSKHKPGDEVPIRFVRRSGEIVKSTLRLEADRRAEIVPIEKTGGTLTDKQKQFRDSWLESKQK